MSRLLAVALLFASLSTTGCVGWGPCGDEVFRGPIRGLLQGLCNTCGNQCCSCEGYNGPYNTVRQNLACGSGCGEVYYGEWVSNPPDTCNECDAAGYAYGANARWPWLCNPWTPLSYKYRQHGVGYGNPNRAVHPGIGQYGGYRPWLWGQQVQGSVCDSGCATGGCATGNCHPNAPGGATLQPIPESAKAPVRKKVTKVNYQSPLIQTTRSKSQSQVAPASYQADSTQVQRVQYMEAAPANQPVSGGNNRATFRSRNNSVPAHATAPTVRQEEVRQTQGRLRTIGSLR